MINISDLVSIIREELAAGKVAKGAKEIAKETAAQAKADAAVHVERQKATMNDICRVIYDAAWPQMEKSYPLVDAKASHEKHGLSFATKLEAAFTAATKVLTDGVSEAVKNATDKDAVKNRFQVCKNAVKSNVMAVYQAAVQGGAEAAADAVAKIDEPAFSFTAEKQRLNKAAKQAEKDEVAEVERQAAEAERQRIATLENTLFSVQPLIQYVITVLDNASDMDLLTINVSELDNLATALAGALERRAVAQAALQKSKQAA